MFERIKLAVTPLAHSRIRVKQIIEKPMESRKNYVLRQAETMDAIVTLIAPRIGHPA
jgi:preprotein translocase subunit Sec63